jgi:hypothetical protein
MSVQMNASDRVLGTGFSLMVFCLKNVGPNGFPDCTVAWSRKAWHDPALTRTLERFQYLFTTRIAFTVCDLKSRMVSSFNNTGNTQKVRTFIDEDDKKWMLEPLDRAYAALQDRRPYHIKEPSFNLNALPADPDECPSLADELQNAVRSWYIENRPTNAQFRVCEGLDMVLRCYKYEHPEKWSEHLDGVLNNHVDRDRWGGWQESAARHRLPFDSVLTVMFRLKCYDWANGERVGIGMQNALIPRDDEGPDEEIPPSLRQAPEQEEEQAPEPDNWDSLWN